MYSLVFRALAGLFVFVVVLFSTAAGSAQGLTIQVGTPPPTAGAATPLVRHDDTWFFRKGTNAPQANWQTIEDGLLDTSWDNAPGGFGYGDNAITNTPGASYESTRLNDMRYTYTSLFIRKTFNVASPVDSNATLVLTVDYDDAFVAYLDGVEIRRVNMTNAIGSLVLNTATAAGNHEASCCNAPTNPPAVYDLGAVGNRLAPGPHILALVGLNDAAESSDFHLIADLAWKPATPPGSVVNNGLYALTSSNRLVLSGTNTIAGSTRVTVNGDSANFDPLSGAWTKTQTLSPGLNRLFVAALDESGNLLSNLTQDIVYEAGSTTAGGTLVQDTAWTNVNAVVHVTSTVTVPAGVTLTIGPGVVVIVSQGASIVTSAGGAIEVEGTDERKVWFLPATTNVWNEIAAAGAGSSLTLRHADVNRGAVMFRNGATGLMEDTYVHDYKNGTIPIAGCTSAASVTVRRCHFNVYHETLWQYTPTVIEDSLFENANNPSSDALDFDGAPAGSVIRRCTFRNGLQSNTDAIDIGSTSTATLIEDCLMHDFPNDKGVSIGETSYAITVRNCLMYRLDSGVAVKDDCTAIVENCTITESDYGFRNFNKANPAAPTGGGHITNSANNILWNNGTTISLLNASTLTAQFSDFSGTNWPGTGNISDDPLFVNAAARDYRLQLGSPCIGTGKNGTNMGVIFPVGGIPSSPFHLAAVSAGTDVPRLAWREDADNEIAFLVERSIDGAVWNVIGSAAANATNFTDDTAVLGQRYYYRVRSTNESGASPWSNLASAARQAAGTTDSDSDGMPDDWENDHGLVVGVNDGAADADDDGLTNAEEYVAGTDPQDKASRLFVTVAVASVNAVISFDAAANKTYTVEYRNTVDGTSNWSRLQDVPAGPARVVNITNAPATQAQFFRVVTPRAE